jgi:hypothetical protein
MTAETAPQEDLKTVLINKYRDLFVDKLTREDLDKLQFYLRREYDPERGWNREYRRKFEQKLREYMHEEILTREIAGIETLVPLMKPEDLETPG